MKKATQIALVALAVGLAACGDSAVAPKSQATTTDQTIVGGGSTASLSAWDTVRFSFVIDPSRQTFYYLGAGNSITFPAGTLCNPYTSSYGVGQWDKPCNVATAPLTVNATAWLDKYNHPHIDFNPSIRFVPSADPLKWVTLSFTDYSASWLSSSVIGYCHTKTSTCQDEATDDPTMVTVRDPITGRLTRRIKHFSGYNVFSGRDDDGSSDGSMSKSPTSGSARLSGGR